ncbi:MAG: hypothetical protein H0U33_05605, partial [Solirubrobacterales bacterium]|nr:hypothetical protein [Solirubrobacterales bacterium]
MKDAAFATRRAPDWEELDALLGRAGTRPERLGPDGVLRLGALYRAAAADLAFARRALPQDPARRRGRTAWRGGAGPSTPTSAAGRG